MTTQPASAKSLGLVLSGGGAQGSYQAGVLKALFEAGLSFRYISGVSIGALNGLLAAQGMIRELEHTWMTLSRMQLISINSLPNLLFSRNISLLSDQVQRDLIEKYINLPQLRSKASELLTAAISLQTGKVHYFSTKKVKDNKLLKAMLLASCAIPGIFPPVVIHGEQFIDGGLLNNTPLAPLLNKKLSHIIIISMEPKSYGSEPLRHMGEIALRSTSIFFREQVNRAQREWQEYQKRYLEYSRLRNQLAQLLAKEKVAKLNQKIHSKILWQIDKILLRHATIPQLHLICPENNLVIQQYDFDSKKIPYTFELGYLDGMKFLKKKAALFSLLKKPNQRKKK